MLQVIGQVSWVLHLLWTTHTPDTGNHTSHAPSDQYPPRDLQAHSYNTVTQETSSFFESCHWIRQLQEPAGLEAQLQEYNSCPVHVNYLTMKTKKVWSKQTDVLQTDLRYAYLCKHRCELPCTSGVELQYTQSCDGRPRDPVRISHRLVCASPYRSVCHTLATSILQLGLGTSGRLVSNKDKQRQKLLGTNCMQLDSQL